MNRKENKKPVFAYAQLQRRVMGYLARFSTSSIRLEHYITRLLRRWREQGEVRITPQEVQAVIAHAVRSGYVDDVRFAQNYITRGHHAGLSLRVLRQRLHQEGLEAEIITQAMKVFQVESSDVISQEPDARRSEQECDRAAAMHYARQRGIGPFRTHDRAQWQQRDIGKFARRGFSRDTTMWVLSQGEQSDQIH